MGISSLSQPIDCQEATSEEDDDVEGKSFVAAINAVICTFWADLDQSGCDACKGQVGEHGA